MSGRVYFDEGDEIKATVGLEAEEHAISFVLVQVDKKTKQKKITLADNHRVLQIFNPTLQGVGCVSDHRKIDDLYIEKVNKIARQYNYSEMKPANYSHIFEFVTLPTNHVGELKNQFSEIEKIEKDLIHYILKQKLDHPDQGLLCVKDWIDDYNKRYPEKPLSGTSASAEMHIVLNLSISELMKYVTEEERLKLVQSKNWQVLANKIHEKLIHHVQFNFVVALGRKMGSMLIEIYEANNQESIFHYEVTVHQEKVSQIQESRKSGSLSSEDADSQLREEEEKIKDTKRYLQLNAIKKEILSRAEYNAEAACDYLREQFSKLSTEEKKTDEPLVFRKLIKLEGFFFLLSMRVLTETENLVNTWGSTKKNDYLFFLKTKLSDLQHSLSENDKTLLHDIDQSWSQDQKQDLFRLIAGSSEALTRRFDDEFSIQDVIESTLGWNKKSLRVCDRLPNHPTKPLEPPPVPKALHRKKQMAPTRRVLLEYRCPSSGPLLHAKEGITTMLKSANDFCKTTRTLQEEWSKTGKEITLSNLKREGLLRQKAMLIDTMKHYNPTLFKAIQYEIPEEIASIESYQRESNTQKQTFFNSKFTVDRVVTEAIRYISELRTFPLKSDPEYTAIKESIQKRLAHDDPDQTLKNINYLFVRTQNAGLIPDEMRQKLHFMLMEMYSEKILAMFPLPVKDSDLIYIRYISNRYAISEHIPAICDFFNFLIAFSHSILNHPNISLGVQNQNLTLEYSFKPDLIAKINSKNQSHELLKHAIKHQLGFILAPLLSSGLHANTSDMLAAFHASILTPALARLFIIAGANLDEESAGLQDKARLIAIKRMLENANLSSASPHLTPEKSKPGNP